MYSQAKRDIGREWYKYMESIKPKADELLKAYEDAKLTDDKDLIKKTGKEYGQFLRQQTYMNKRYKSMLDTITTKLANVNEIALSYLNDEMPSVYAINYNQMSKDMPAGISFDIVDENTVKNLVKDNPKLLPTKKLDIPKDKRWNQKAINAQVLQSIIQGESIPEMAKRLTPIMDRNKKSAIRNARTMTTSAQNKGRLDSYRAGQDKGVVLRKVWMATNSERTRAWHAALNGVEAEIDQPFENDYGKIMFPGDPDADPGNVYNCRCTMRTHIIGFKRQDGSIKYIEGEEPKTVDENTFKVVDGKDISNTWTRRSDKFDFEIEDVINAQGFDGLPKVVGADEFEKAVKESNFIAQRNYSAPDQETLDAYRDQLYSGKWYVDCSAGGAQYGQGMYCAADYTGKITDGMKNEMAHYQELGRSRNDSVAKELAYQKVWNDTLQSANDEEKALIKREFLRNATDEERKLARAFEKRDEDAYDALLDKYTAVAQKAERARDSAEAKSYTETLTLDPSAKVITYKDLQHKKEMQVDKIRNEILSLGLPPEETRKALAEHPNYLKYRDMDDGSFAALFGYDAINAEGHGESGSYTVILNRTKLIIKGE